MPGEKSPHFKNPYTQSPHFVGQQNTSYCLEIDFDSAEFAGWQIEVYPPIAIAVVFLWGYTKMMMY